MRRLLKWLGLALVALLVIIATPIAYTETMCRGTQIPQTAPTHITDPDWQRPEARTYMVYPEWHIVYAYEGYGEAMKTGAPHSFPYVSAITGFWSSLCSLTEKADELGEAGFDSKATIYTIGASFTLEMLFKAAYEETLGRVVSLFGHSPQDAIEAEMAQDYATFLQQVPWYKYDFNAWTTKLSEAPKDSLRAWERHIALGIEWRAKAAYAKVIAQAAEGLGADALQMQIAYNSDQPLEIDDLQPLEQTGDVTRAEVPRYRIFTRIATELAAQGGEFIEIAGNDDILVSVISDRNAKLPALGEIISQTDRPGFADQRHLIAVKVTDLAGLIRAIPTDIRLEHIYDY